MDYAQSLRQLLHDQALYPLFQPIVDTASDTIIGYESLIRGPKGHPLEFPDKLFEVAQQYDLLSELELACRSAAIKEFLKLDTKARLFINVNPNVLQDDHHPHGSTLTLSQQYGLNPERIVIEISERYPIQKTDLLKQAVQHYQSLGFMVAIDDLGSGYSGLKLWSEIKPDFVKIDRYFITNLQNDLTKREFIQSILSLAQNLSARVIAEGIETEDELTQLHLLNQFLCQGFLLGRPSRNPPMEAPKNHGLKNLSSDYYNGAIEKIASVTKATTILSPYDKAQVAMDLFADDKNLSAIPVIQSNLAVGMLRRESLMELFSGSYGRALYANKDIARIMDNNPVIVDLHTPVEHVSSIITEDKNVDIFKEFIVTQEDQYYGVASVRDLLRKITDVRVQNARYANPLTLLPGNVPIHKTLDNLLFAKKPLAVAYFDINYFKPFNDNYGYSQGDEVIRFVGQLLRHHVVAASEFAGHIGGDDFVAIFEDLEQVEDKCQAVIDEFEAGLSRFYPASVLAQGQVEATGRDGQITSFPLLAIAVGIVVVKDQQFHSHHEIAALASAAKKTAKGHQGSALHFDFY